MRGKRIGMAAALVASAAAFGVGVAPAGADGSVEVATSAEFIAAFDDGTTDEIVLTADITLEAQPSRPLGSDALTVRGNGFSLAAAPGSAALYANAAAGDLTVYSLAIDGAEASAIRWINGTVSVFDSSFEGNSTNSAGGAIFANGAPKVIVAGSSFVDNTAAAVGGAIWTNGDVEISNSDFFGNEAEDGGGAVSTDGGGTVTVEESTFFENTSLTSNGGAIDAAGGGVINGSTFEGNTADQLGGAIASGGDIDINESSIVDNAAPQGGGVGARARVLLVNSTVAINQAEVGGGTWSGDLELVYATYAGNSAATGANAASYDSDILTSFGSVLDQPDGGDSCSGFGSTTSQGYNAESAGDTCGFDADTDQVDLAVPQTGELVDDGRLGLMAPPISPSPDTPVDSESTGPIGLIDAIPTDACQDGGAVGIGVDQRLVSRPEGAGCDIGAIEVLAGEPEPEPEPEPGPEPEPEAPGATPVAGNPSYTG